MPIEIHFRLIKLIQKPMTGAFLHFGVIWRSSTYFIVECLEFFFVVILRFYLDVFLEGETTRGYTGTGSFYVYIYMYLQKIWVKMDWIWVNRGGNLHLHLFTLDSFIIYSSLLLFTAYMVYLIPVFTRVVSTSG